MIQVQQRPLLPWWGQELCTCAETSEVKARVPVPLPQWSRRGQALGRWLPSGGGMSALVLEGRVAQLSTPYTWVLSGSLANS